MYYIFWVNKFYLLVRMKWKIWFFGKIMENILVWWWQWKCLKLRGEFQEINTQRVGKGTVKSEDIEGKDTGASQWVPHTSSKISTAHDNGWGLESPLPTPALMGRRLGGIYIKVAEDLEKKSETDKGIQSWHCFTTPTHKVATCTNKPIRAQE